MDPQTLIQLLKSGAHRRPYTPKRSWQPSRTSGPITLGTRTFPSEHEAHSYVRNLMDRTTAGQELSDLNDIEMLRDLVKQWTHYSTLIEPFGVIGFTVREHCNSKVLVVLLAGNAKSIDVSIERSLRNMKGKHVTTIRNVSRCDDDEWIMAA